MPALVDALTARFVYKRSPHAAWLQFYGVGDPPPALVEELKRAGWMEPTFGAPPVPVEYRNANTEGIQLVQPHGSGLFSAPTASEAAPRLKAARALLRRHGIRCSQHRLTPGESL